MNKKYTLMAFLLLGGLVANAQTGKKKRINKKQAAAEVVQPSLNKIDSASYSFGFKIAQGLKSDGVDSLNYQLFSKALEDVFKGGQTLVNDEEAYKAINVFLTEKREIYVKKVTEEGKKFLEENKNKPNVKTTESGLQYEVITLGNGVKPKATDQVTVHYKGTLLNGKQFDSSYDRGEPVTFPLNQVIPGWTEGVQLMPIGSKYKFYIPYNLAYGERGAGQDIPPYSTLIFDVELLKIGEAK